MLKSLGNDHTEIRNRLQIFLAFKRKLARNDLQRSVWDRKGSVFKDSGRWMSCSGHRSPKRATKPTQFLPAPHGLYFTLNRAMLNVWQGIRRLSGD